MIFFVLTLGIHRQLAEDRPPTNMLGIYYFWLSLGGAVGGLTMLLAAPILFERIREYLIGIGIAALIVGIPVKRPIPDKPQRQIRKRGRSGTESLAIYVAWVGIC